MAKHHTLYVMWRITPPDHLSCVQISPHDQIFSTGTARGARDKYEVWGNTPLGTVFLHSRGRISGPYPCVENIDNAPAMIQIGKM